MSRFGTGKLGLALCLAVIAGAGCGSSSKSKSTPSRATTPTPSAPAASSTPSTPTTASGGAAPSPSLLPSTQINSTQYHDVLVKSAEKDGKSPAQANALASCLQKVLVGAGINKVGDADKVKTNPATRQQVVSGSLQCAKA